MGMVPLSPTPSMYTKGQSPAGKLEILTPLLKTMFTASKTSLVIPDKGLLVLPHLEGGGGRVG